MNILFAADVSISNVIGGAERVLYEQSTRLAQRGHHVYILTRRLPEHLSANETIQGVHECRYDVLSKNALSFLRSTISNIQMISSDLLQQFPIDCINYHQPFSAYGLNRSLTAHKIRRIYTCHSLSFEEYQSRNPMPQPLMKKLSYIANVHVRKWIEKRALRSSDKIIALSLYTKNKLRSTYGISSDKISVIPGGVDLERFYPSVDKSELRKRLSIPENHIIIFTVRNLVPRMGLENLIHAMENVVANIKNVTLLIGGTGPLKENLMALTQQLGLEKHIRFIGFIPEANLPDYYRLPDLFVLPTVELEGFGLVTLEALASGVPVLGTPVGGTLEILKNFDDQYLFQSSKPEDMSDLILEFYHHLIQDQDFRQNISAQCRHFAEQNYSWERNVDALESIFYGNS